MFKIILALLFIVINFEANASQNKSVYANGSPKTDTITNHTIKDVYLDKFGPSNLQQNHLKNLQVWIKVSKDGFDFSQKYKEWGSMGYDALLKALGEYKLSTQGTGHTGLDLEIAVGKKVLEYAPLNTREEIMKQVTPSSPSKYNAITMGESSSSMPLPELNLKDFMSSFDTYIKNRDKFKIALSSEPKEIEGESSVLSRIEELIPISTQDYNLYLTMRSKKPLETLEKEIEISKSEWIKVMKFLRKNAEKIMISSSKAEKGESSKEISPDIAIETLLTSFDEDEKEDEIRDTLFEECINILIKNKASPVLKADLMFNLHELRSNDGYSEHLRTYANYFLTSLDDVTFFADAVPLYEEKVNTSARIKTLISLGENWNVVKEESPYHFVTKDTYETNKFLKGVDAIPMMTLLQKNLKTVFTKINGGAIQKWTDLLDYTPHAIIKALYYVIMNVTIIPESYKVKTDPTKVGAIEGFLGKLKRYAEDEKFQPKNPAEVLDSLKLKEGSLAALSFTIETWEKLPPNPVGRFNKESLLIKKVEDRKFKLNKDLKATYIPKYREIEEKRLLSLKPKEEKKKINIFKLKSLFKQVTGKSLGTVSLTGNMSDTPEKIFTAKYLKYFSEKSEEEVKDELGKLNLNGELDEYKAKDSPTFSPPPSSLPTFLPPPSLPPSVGDVNISTPLTLKKKFIPVKPSGSTPLGIGSLLNKSSSPSIMLSVPELGEVLEEVLKEKAIIEGEAKEVVDGSSYPRIHISLRKELENKSREEVKLLLGEKYDQGALNAFLKKNK